MEITGALEDAKEVVTKLTGAIDKNNRMLEQKKGEISKKNAFLAINQAFETLQQTLEERKTCSDHFPHSKPALSLGKP